MRLNTIQIDGRTVAYQDLGHGTPVILAHCSSASHKEWRALPAVLGTGYRVVAPDLIGYGKSAPWRADQPFDPLTDVNVLLGLVTRTGEQVHLAGHSYGAATALEAARLLGPRVKSLTLVEPVAFHLLRLAGRAVEWDEVATVARRVRTAVAEGRPRRAAVTYMSFWIGRLRWWLMAPQIRHGIVSTVAKVAAEFGIMQQLTTTLADYAGIVAPTRLIVGGRTRRPARAVTDVLLEVLPDAHLRVVPKAGHMSPFTHTATVNSLIVEHIASCERRSPARRGQTVPLLQSWPAAHIPRRTPPAPAAPRGLNGAPPPGSAEGGYANPPKHLRRRPHLPDLLRHLVSHERHRPAHPRDHR